MKSVRQLNLGVISKVAPYSDAIIISSPTKWLSTSGTPGVDSYGRVPKGFIEQANCAWDNAFAAIKAGGMSIQDIVRVTHFLVRREDLLDYRAICEKKLGTHRPTSTLIFAASLPWPEMLIEIQIDAIQSI
jgi:2-iminobutanoate/2-iminopropanoate deaminase